MSQKVKLSAVVITFNEEKNIERCLLSLQEVADEILVVDSYSEDKTQEICARFGVRFVQHHFDGFIEQRTWAFQNAAFDHVLAVDADEALSDKLKKSILQVKQNWIADGYTFNRLTNYCGSWIRHCSWYPDVKLRLWDRRKGYVGGTNPHDKVVITEKNNIQHIKGDLLHYSYYSISEHIAQLNKFTDISAAECYQKGKKSPSLISILLRAKWKLIRDYVFRLGFLDGYAGFLVCGYSAVATFTKYAKLKQLHSDQKKK